MRFSDATFRATHNSYSGGPRGTLRDQLDGGVRFFELDVHSDDYRARGYQIGHFLPGHEVSESGSNPDDRALRSWLAHLAEWSDEHQDRAPITVTLDLKDDLTEGEGFEDGNPAALNALLAEVFGERIFRPAECEAEWPNIDELRGRIVVVLSGDLTTRRGYLRDGGARPAVALNSGGTVVEVHGSGSGALWYWTGRRDDGEVAWRRHGRYGAGESPAVALSEEGVVVSVHSRIGHGAAARVGRVDPESFEISWSREAGADLPYVASNPEPSVRFVDGATLRVTYESSDGRVAQHGRLEGERVVWDGPGEARPATAEEARSHRNHAERDGSTVAVVAVPDGLDGTRLLYGTEAVESEPIRYEQVAFVEGQFASPPLESDLGPIAGDDVEFFATKATLGANHDWARAWREKGKLVRLWNFDEEAAERGRFTPSFAASDHPKAGWYAGWCEKRGAVDA